MGSFYRYLNVEFVSHIDIIQPNMTDADKFYKVYSPEKFKLAPREDIYLDLKFDINTLPKPNMHQNMVKFITIFKNNGTKIRKRRLGIKQNKRQDYSIAYT